MLTPKLRAFKSAYLAQFNPSKRVLNQNPFLPFTLMSFTDDQLDSLKTTEHHHATHNHAIRDLHHKMLCLETYDPNQPLTYNANELRCDLLDACVTHVNAPIFQHDRIHKLTSNVTAFDLVHYRDYDVSVINTHFNQLMHIVNDVNLRTPRAVLYCDVLHHLDYPVDDDTDTLNNNPSVLLDHSFSDPRLISYYIRMYDAHQLMIKHQYADHDADYRSLLETEQILSYS